MEKVPIIRANFVDLTETSGIGCLSEMSIVEVSINCDWFGHDCSAIYLASREVVINENHRRRTNEGKKSDN